eukprot:CAMPEP_0180814970 /NCGR_PEP_ID=MMETSP1038_2-20121128/67355_1 /TAXON_ID=632150 /ORGANISM="Azadinium spinosum, Strain 3D9" /LENGTH=49 /DNA_ID= /DNA_START= /DNA_END= /DNA_ORIENTATION=
MWATGDNHARPSGDVTAATSTASCEGSKPTVTARRHLRNHAGAEAYSIQ